MMKKNDELEKLKTLVREFLKEIDTVPMRAVDCNQAAVKTLWNQLVKATEK